MQCAVEPRPNLGAEFAGRSQTALTTSTCPRRLWGGKSQVTDQSEKLQVGLAGLQKVFERAEWQKEGMPNTGIEPLIVSERYRAYNVKETP